MTVTITAGGYCRPKKICTGLKYTKIGITCAVSSSTRITRSALSERAARMPNGMPSTRAMMTATDMIDSVRMARSQSAITPTPNIAAAPVIAARMPPVRQPMAPVMATTPGQRSANSSDSMLSTAHVSASLIGLKKAVKMGEDWRFSIDHWYLSCAHDWMCRSSQLGTSCASTTATTASTANAAKPNLRCCR